MIKQVTLDQEVVPVPAPEKTGIETRVKLNDLQSGPYSTIPYLMNQEIVSIVIADLEKNGKLFYRVSASGETEHYLFTRRDHGKNMVRLAKDDQRLNYILYQMGLLPGEPATDMVIRSLVASSMDYYMDYQGDMEEFVYQMLSMSIDLDAKPLTWEEWVERYEDKTRAREVIDLLWYSGAIFQLRDHTYVSHTTGKQMPISEFIEMMHGYQDRGIQNDPSDYDDL